MSSLITIVDYGTSNLQAVYRRMLQTGASMIVSNEANDILRADKIIVPGIGHFDRAMRNLKSLRLIDVLHEAVTHRQKPVLGICLGMQLMAERSEEGGDEPGLGWIKGTVGLLPVEDGGRYKVPHMGWNTAVSAQPDCPLMRGLAPESSFYFTHSYHFQPADHASVLQTTRWSVPFASAVAQENIFGVQYHPEKSYEAGLQLLKNFAAL